MRAKQIMDIEKKIRKAKAEQYNSIVEQLSTHVDNCMFKYDKTLLMEANKTVFLLLKKYFDIELFRFSSQKEVDEIFFDCVICRYLPKECEGAVLDMSVPELINQNDVIYKAAYMTNKIFKNKKCLVDKLHKIMNQFENPERNLELQLEDIFCNIYYPIEHYLQACEKYEAVDRYLIGFTLSLLQYKYGFISRFMVEWIRGELYDDME